MKNLRKVRKIRGFTCESLGERLNVEKSTVSRYERSEIQPSKEVLIKMAEVLSCTTDYLLGITNNPEVSLYETPFQKNITILGEVVAKALVDGGVVNSEAELTPEIAERTGELIHGICTYFKKV